MRTPLVGRTEELSLLHDGLARAISGKSPTAITIIGGAGVGKSRLVDEFLRLVGERERRVRVFRGIAREGGPAFNVLRRILRARFHISEARDAKATAEAFRKTVSATFDDRRVSEFLHFLGAFVDLSFPDSPFIKAVEDDPAQFALISRAVLRRFFEVDAENGPLVLTFEDLHLAQDDSLDLIQYLIKSLRDAPILMIITARPELLARRASWVSGREGHAKIELSPLGPDDARALVASFLEPLGEVPEELSDAAVDMAGGNPYLLEQIVRTYFDNGTLTVEPDGRFSAHLERLAEAHLPLTVEDAISARIASLTPAERELLEKASTMGSVFWLGALIALSRIGKTTPDLWGGHESLLAHYHETLESLADRDYVLRMPDSTVPFELEFAFKHNLERETLHKLASRTQMRRFHLVVAEWLEFRLGERGEEQYDMLAQHYEEGGAAKKAARYYIRAGNRARNRYANAKAAEYYGRGIELLGDEDVTLRIDALHHHGDVLQRAGRNEDALRAFRSMLEIAFRLDLKAKGGAAHNRLGRVYRAIGKLDQAMRNLGTGLALFDAASDPRGVASSLDDIGKVHWMRGSYEDAERFMKQALERRLAIGDERSIALSYNNLGLVYQDSGRFGEALDAFEEANARRKEIGDHQGMAQTLNNLGTIHQDRGDHARAGELYHEAFEMARQVGDRMQQAVILTNLGESHYRRGSPEDAIVTLSQAEEISSTLGDWILEGEILRGLAKAHLLVEEYDKAHDYITRAIDRFEKARGRPFLGVALRTQGEIAAAAGWNDADRERARRSFERAIDIFDELGNEVELAKSCETFAEFLERDLRDPKTAQHIVELRTRAAYIRDKQLENEGIEVDFSFEGEVTLPGGPLPDREEGGGPSDV